MFIDQILIDTLYSSSIKNGLKESVVIEASNVSENFYVNPKVEWDLARDFPNVAPPFKNFFLEFRAPSIRITEKGMENWPKENPVRWGLWCIDGFIEPEPEDLLSNSLGALNEAQWVVSIILFARWKGGSYLGPHWRWDVYIKSDGSLILNEQGKVAIANAPLDLTAKRLEQEPETFKETEESLRDFLMSGFLAISFMHCKNVVLRKETPPAVQPTPKQKRQRVQPYQPVTYHVLDIEPMKQVLKTEGKSEQVGLQRALHICRGHFSTYTEDHKLFGKYAGTFWIPQHVRGSAESGFAAKDYRIKLEK